MHRCVCIGTPALPCFHTCEAASFCPGHRFSAVFQLPPGLVPGTEQWPEAHPLSGSAKQNKQLKEKKAKAYQIM